MNRSDRFMWAKKDCTVVMPEPPASDKILIARKHEEPNAHDERCSVTVEDES